MKNVKNLIHYRRQPIQPTDEERPHMRCIRTPSMQTSRVIHPELIEERTEAKKKLYEESLRNNGNWSSMLNRTSNEKYITKKVNNKESNTFKSSIFNNDDNIKEYQVNRQIRHKRPTSYSKYSTTTQIYSIPGGNKRNEEHNKGIKVFQNLQKDDFFDNNYQPRIIRNKYNNDNGSGKYCNRNKNKSQILNGNNNSYYSKNNDIDMKGAFGIPSNIIKTTGKARQNSESFNNNFKGAFGIPSGAYNWNNRNYNNIYCKSNNYY